MKTKRFCWILLLNLLVLTAGAEPYETVVLKNGSVLEGYISVQHPGKDIIFFAEKATVYIPVKQVKSVLEYDIEIETLSDPWKAWVGDNPLLIKTVRGSKFWQRLTAFWQKPAENDTVVLDSAVVRETNTPLYSNWNVVPRKVCILEKGEVIKYLDFTPNSYYLVGKIYRLSNVLPGHDRFVRVDCVGGCVRARSMKDKSSNKYRERESAC